MSDFNVFQFDKTKVENDDRFLHQLSNFYCNIWRFDPNFAEYRQCPQYEKYFSYNEWKSGIKSCPECQTELVEAWEEEKVAETIKQLVSMEKDFFGAVALLPDFTDTIIGFTWGFNKPLIEVRDETVFHAVNNSCGYTPYFNEIATNPTFRLKGIGSALCRQLVCWMQRTSPEVPGYLHTHENSPARRLFERAGYKFLCYDNHLGNGRIFMYVDKCKNFTPENLK